MSEKKSYRVSSEIVTLIEEYALMRDISETDAIERLVSAGHSRLSTLRKHAAKKSKEKKAEKKAEKKTSAPKAAKAEKTAEKKERKPRSDKGKPRARAASTAEAAQ